MFGYPPRELPERIGLVLVPSFSMIAFTAAIEALRLANRVSGQRLYEWALFSVDGRAVRAVTASEATAAFPPSVITSIVALERISL